MSVVTLPLLRKVGDSGLRFKDNYIDLSLPITGMNWGLGDFAVEALVSVDDFAMPSTVGFIVRADTPESITAWGLYLTTDSFAVPADRRKAVFHCRDAATAYRAVFSDLPLSPNRWYHLLGLRLNQVIYLYVCNVRQTNSTPDVTMNYSNPTALKIASTSGVPGLYFYGIVSYVKIYNGLTRSQISSAFLGYELPDMRLNMRLDEGSGLVAYDSSTYANHGSLLPALAPPTWLMGHRMYPDIPSDSRQAQII